MKSNISATDTLSTDQASTIVIFGASGDLTRRKLVPALHSLACGGHLHPSTRVIGVARSSLTDKAFRERLLDGVKNYARLKPSYCELWSKFAKRYTYLSGSYDDPETYRQLANRLEELRAETGTKGNCLFYLATPPVLYPIIIEQLGQAGLHHSDHEGNPKAWRRIIIEKPFGTDTESARQLNQQVHAVFDENSVYRIDHYLGKETVQNILTFRFGNAIFEPLWNRNYIDHVQITVAESVDVGHRAGYYEKAGVLRDMFQNHLLQLLTLTAMEPSAHFEANGLRDEKAKVLRAVRPVVENVRGQYIGYRQEPDVAPNSQTPTYAALQVMVDNWRWKGVPFYLRSGKALAKKVTEITIQFKSVPHSMFPPRPERDIRPNILSLCLQPDEGIHLRFEAKEPGAGMQTRSVDMEFHYKEDFGATSLPEAYERLLLDAMQGDAALFARGDEIELAWGVIDPILARWEAEEAAPLAFYEPESWGPVEADYLLGRDGRSWLHGCGVHGEK